MGGERLGIPQACGTFTAFIYMTHQPRPGWPSDGEVPPSAGPGLVTATAQEQSITSQSTFFDPWLPIKELDLPRGRHGQRMFYGVSPAARMASV